MGISNSQILNPSSESDRSEGRRLNPRSESEVCQLPRLPEGCGHTIRNTSIPRPHFALAPPSLDGIRRRHPRARRAPGAPRGSPRRRLRAGCRQRCRPAPRSRSRSCGPPRPHRSSSACRVASGRHSRCDWCPPHGARAKAWCLLIHAEPSLIHEAAWGRAKAWFLLVREEGSLARGGQGKSLVPRQTRERVSSSRAKAWCLLVLADASLSLPADPASVNERATHNPSTCLTYRNAPSIVRRVRCCPSRDRQDPRDRLDTRRSPAPHRDLCRRRRRDRGHAPRVHHQPPQASQPR
jgi:hypothetical protein